MRPSHWLFVWLAAAGSVAAQAPGDAAPPADADQALEQRIETMQDQMKRIRSEKDPAERAKLMREHMRSMHDGMAMMDHSGKGADDGPNDHAAPSRCRPDDTQCRVGELEGRQQRGEQRMRAMQGMMRQMLDQLDAAQSPGQSDRPAPDAPAPDAPVPDHQKHH